MRHFKMNKYDTYITIKLAAANVQKLHFKKKKQPAAVYVHLTFPTTSALIHRNFSRVCSVQRKRECRRRDGEIDSKKK